MVVNFTTETLLHLIELSVYMYLQVLPQSSFDETIPTLLI